MSRLSARLGPQYRIGDSGVKHNVVFWSWRVPLFGFGSCTFSPNQRTARVAHVPELIGANHAVADFERSTMNLGRGALSPRARTGTPVSPILCWLPRVRCP